MNGVMSIEQAMARVREIQTAFARPAAAQVGGPSVQFASVLGQQRASLGVSPLAPVGAAGGSVGQQIVALAQREIGVREEPMGSNDSPRIAEYRKATAGSGIGPWCAYFTSWLAKSAGAPLGEAGQGFGLVDAVYGWAQRTGKAIPNGPGVTPQPGDLIVWDEHIGVVESVDPDGTVRTIEGNSSNQVIRRTHEAGSALGYVRVG